DPDAMKGDVRGGPHGKLERALDFSTETAVPERGSRIAVSLGNLMGGEPIIGTQLRTKRAHVRTPLGVV
ncbi:MAG: hypothetical protein AAGA48_19760, partial [Myxococcota bacterium]